MDEIRPPVPWPFAQAAEITATESPPLAAAPLYECVVTCGSWRSVCVGRTDTEARAMAQAALQDYREVTPSARAIGAIYKTQPVDKVRGKEPTGIVIEELSTIGPPSGVVKAGHVDAGSLPYTVSGQVHVRGQVHVGGFVGPAEVMRSFGEAIELAEAEFARLHSVIPRRHGKSTATHGFKSMAEFANAVAENVRSGDVDPRLQLQAEQAEAQQAEALAPADLDPNNDVEWFLNCARPLGDAGHRCVAVAVTAALDGTPALHREGDRVADVERAIDWRLEQQVRERAAARLAREARPAHVKEAIAGLTPRATGEASRDHRMGIGRVVE